ncbi:hypothetical protein VPHK469_0161 [Vibrio phage K469]
MKFAKDLWEIIWWWLTLLAAVVRGLCVCLWDAVKPEKIHLIDDPDLAIPEVGTKWVRKNRARGDDAIVQIVGFNHKTRVVTYYMSNMFPRNEMCLWMWYKLYEPIEK